MSLSVLGGGGKKGAFTFGKAARLIPLALS